MSELGSEGRHALVVATAKYSDPKLQQLRAPAADARRLAAVLSDPEKGNFEVEVLLDETHARVTRRIATFFAERRPQDLLLLHFSCHGVKDDRGELFLAAHDTEIDLLSATGVSAAWLNDQITRTRSRRTVVLLDCCFSGSFPFGMRARGGGVDAPDQLQGRGRVIITASNAMEYAYEGDELRGEGHPSIFTEAVVDGLDSGRADLDHDQLVSVDDLYNYVYDRVKDKTPSQTPSRKSDLEGPLYLARSSYQPEIRPATLDPGLLERTEDRYAGIRVGAAQELAELLRSRDPSVALAARHALSRMVDDDSRRVATAAQAALAGDEPPPPEPPPPADRPPPEPPLPAAQPSPSARGRPRWLVPALAAGVLAIAALAFVLVGGGGGDGDGGSASSDGLIDEDNEVSNPSFEADATGWDPFNGRVAVEPADDAPDGSNVALLTLATAPDDYALDDEPESIESSVGGESYAATAWVKATEATEGKVICIGIREEIAGTEDEYAGQVYGSVRATADAYRELRVSYVATTDGNRIGVHVFRQDDDVAEGEGFYADAISLATGVNQVSGGDC